MVPAQAMTLLAADGKREASVAVSESALSGDTNRMGSVDMNAGTIANVACFHIVCGFGGYGRPGFDSLGSGIFCHLAPGRTEQNARA